jgi:hypothetical protein
MSFIKQNFQFLIICILAFVIILERSCGEKTPTPKPTITVVRDTTWATPPAPIVNVYPTITNKIPAAVVQQGHDTLFLPSTNDSILRIQYKALRDSLLSQNIYNQTYRQDSSSIDIVDTVSQNKLLGRSYKFNLKYPIVTNTITIKEPYIPVAQVFFGGGFSGSQLQPIQDFHVGALLKTKKDQVYGVKAGLSPVGGLVIGADMYWKIKLRK